MRVIVLAGGLGSSVANAIATTLMKFNVPVEFVRDLGEADLIVCDEAKDFRRYRDANRAVVQYVLPSTSEVVSPTDLAAAGPLGFVCRLDAPDSDVLSFVRYVERTISLLEREPIAMPMEEEGDKDEEQDLRKVLIDRLDGILHALGEMDRALVAAPRTEDVGMIREARRQTRELLEAAQRFFTWVADTRLDPPPN